MLKRFAVTFVACCILQESTRSATVEATEKRARVEKNPRGGKATTSTKGKGPARRPALPIDQPSSSSQQISEDDWDIPEETSEVSDFEEPVGDESVGESTSACSSRPRRAFGSMPAHPRTEHVPDTLRKKIREGEYVDLKLLLPHPRGEKPTKKFAINDGVFEEVEDNTNLVFYPWLDAFIIFMSIYLEFYPAEVQGLLRHLEIVKSFHSAGKDGVEYDYQFRRLKSRNSDMVWGEFISELAGTIKENKAAQQKKADSAKKKTQAKPPVCFKFNSAEGCKFGSRCKYTHKCKKCSSFDHPEYRCSRK